MTYSIYLESEWWGVRRRRALALSGYRCQVCNTGKRMLHVHHRTYDNLFHERDNDLTVLCDRCHELFHKHLELEKEIECSQFDAEEPTLPIWIADRLRLSDLKRELRSVEVQEIMSEIITYWPEDPDFVRRLKSRRNRLEHLIFWEEYLQSEEVA